jgi:cation transport protein ChaC
MIPLEPEADKLRGRGTQAEAGKMQDLWVFGYGSLMWNPGFPHRERVAARLRGWHRALCIYSWFHRGTPEKPGLVLGLDRGGSCRGIAFRVAASDSEATIAYLREREQVTSVYQEMILRIELLGTDNRQVSALTYVADRSQPQYAGHLPPEELERFVRQGVGNSGMNPAYVLATVDHMKEAGIPDERLFALAARLRADFDYRP